MFGHKQLITIKNQLQAGLGLEKGVAQKQFDTGHERVQVAITRLTDL